MAVINPRVVHVCDKCGEYFHYAEGSSECPDCNEGKLVKMCSFCSEEFEKCKCSAEELERRCHNCGFIKSECKCSS